MPKSVVSVVSTRSTISKKSGCGTTGVSTGGNEIYKRHTHREHILEVPDTYVGSCETMMENRWVICGKKILYKTIQFNPGLYKIFDEILVNARDAYIRAKTTEGRLPVTRIDISVESTVEDGTKITVSNDGDGIPIEASIGDDGRESEILIPELIFGHLLTSSNYDKEEEKIVGGKNGYGAKLTNIFSKEFTVLINSLISRKKYVQTWSNNMTVCNKPSVRKWGTGSKGLVSIEFHPDMCRFPGSQKKDGTLIDDMMSVFNTRAIELASLVSAKVYWNGTMIQTNNFKKYIQLFLRDGVTSYVYENCGERWEIGACLARDLYTDEETGVPEDKHISFVNGIMTKKGGKHVDNVMKHVLGDFCELAKKKKVEIKPGQVRDKIVLFINATIVNPSFDSQTKEYLTTPVSKFGSTPKTTGVLSEGLMKLGLLELAKQVLDEKAMKEAKKTDGKSKSVIRGIPKLEDALWAKERDSAKRSACTLILTEGDSAASSAISGLTIVGREKWGVFPLRGKLPNVRDLTLARFNENAELTALKKILGLEQGKVYKSIKDLRYGRIMIMADQDHDGSHIKGLVMNLFHTEWPELLKSGFICSLMTPLLKATKLSGSREVISFYSMSEFERWKEGIGGTTRGWSIKYYKGLGTSTATESREWFKKLNEIKYKWDESTDEAMNLAFNKKKADERKLWLSSYKPELEVLRDEEGGVRYSEFVNKELIHFSNEDNIRSIPNLMDGLKPSQRKILYACFKRDLRSEIRVAQLSGYISEHASYHHGEASLNGAIIGMAQNFVGSNNINILQPIGQFGSRLLGGDDSASPRYIHTKFDPIIDTIYYREDKELLEAMLDDDGCPIEPKYYLPVVPMILMNGAIGIGTGFSTNIPPFNPSEIVSLMKCRLEGTIETLNGHQLDPWWFGFTGSVIRYNENTWATKGRWVVDYEKQTVTITELPVGTWTKKYKEFLDEIIQVEEKNIFGLKSFDDLYNDMTVKFVLYYENEGLNKIVEYSDDYEQHMKLITTWKTSNMYVFDNELNIRKFKTIGDILEEFMSKRLPEYERRRELILDRLRREIIELDAKVVFIRAVSEGRLELSRKTDKEIVEGMKRCGVPALSGDEEDERRGEKIEGYEYVLKLRIDRVKESAIREMMEQAERKREAMMEMEKKSGADIWMEDIDRFMVGWGKYSMERESAYNTEGSMVMTGKKRGGKKTK